MAQITKAGRGCYVPFLLWAAAGYQLLRFIPRHSDPCVASFAISNRQDDNFATRSLLFQRTVLLGLFFFTYGFVPFPDVDRPTSSVAETGGAGTSAT